MALHKTFSRLVEHENKSDGNKSEIDKLVKKFPVIRVEIDFQRAEAIQLVQVVEGTHYEKLEN